jgi:hypothetical protein
MKQKKNRQTIVERSSGNKIILKQESGLFDHPFM